MRKQANQDIKHSSDIQTNHFLKEKCANIMYNWLFQMKHKSDDSRFSRITLQKLQVGTIFKLQVGGTSGQLEGSVRGSGGIDFFVWRAGHSSCDSRANWSSSCSEILGQ